MTAERPELPAERGAALHADHVIVVLVIEEMFVTGDAIGKVNLASQAALREEFHCSIDGRIADPGILGFDTPVNVFDAAMPFMVQEGFQNQFTMWGDF